MKSLFYKLPALFIAICLATSVHAGSFDTIIYKTIDTVSLEMEVLFPEGSNPDHSSPAIVFFFGGGWNGGTRDQFRNHAEYLSGRGLVCFLVEYRVKSRHDTSPFEALADAKSAIRYIRKHAGDFNVDPAKIIASGGSAGGHLAAATAMVKGFDEEGEELTLSCVPNALVLFNPVIDNGPGGYGFERIGEAYKSFSPLHNLASGAPPTIFFLGTEDRLIPVATAEYYKTVMERTGGRCDLHLYEGQGHGFFNYRNPEYYQSTLELTDQFLVSLGYLVEKPVM